MTFKDRPDAIPPSDLSGVCPGEWDILAVGADIKNTICRLRDGVSHVTGAAEDVSVPDAYRRFAEELDRHLEAYGRPHAIACDLHPQYLTTRRAVQLGLPVIGVQHHHAHVASLMAEGRSQGPVIGIACDGTGFGLDGAIWGGEILLCERGEMRRLGHLDYFPLIGGDRSAVETWRPAAALLHVATGDGWDGQFGRVFERVSVERRGVFDRQLRRAGGHPVSSSLGRVFDAAAFILGLTDENVAPGQAASALESAAAAIDAKPFSFRAWRDHHAIRMSLCDAMVELAQSAMGGAPAAIGAARFHETVAQCLCEAAELACRATGVSVVGLTGGCFANRRLSCRCEELMAIRGRRVLKHRAVPCGDTGLALGQAYVAAWRLAEIVPSQLHPERMETCA